MTVTTYRSAVGALSDIERCPVLTSCAWWAATATAIRSGDTICSNRKQGKTLINSAAETNYFKQYVLPKNPHPPLQQGTSQYGIVNQFARFRACCVLCGHPMGRHGQSRQRFTWGSGTALAWACCHTVSARYSPASSGTIPMNAAATSQGTVLPRLELRLGREGRHTDWFFWKSTQS